MKICHIVGARPQFIKYIAVHRAMARNADHSNIQSFLVHTGQHYDYNMSKIFFDESNVPEPDIHLNVGSGTHGEQTSKILSLGESVLIKEKPDLVMVYGDTNSTLAGALAASKLHIPVLHVEAGLRSFNRVMAEEINRIVTDHISTVLFCPSQVAVHNLKKEGFRSVLNEHLSDDVDLYEQLEKVLVIDNNHPLVVNSGDVMYDAVLFFSSIAQKRSSILETLDLEGAYALMTLHRAENTDNEQKFKEVANFVNKIAENQQVVFPIHPRTRKKYEKGNWPFHPDIKVIDPVSYFDALKLLSNSCLLMTDSGGMQKEAYWLQVPCITLREETEWIETVKNGWNVLYKQYTGKHNYQKSSKQVYGDGHAAELIINLISRLPI
jgi:UDP-GlcNAc3NAcA epimerase